MRRLSAWLVLLVFIPAATAQVRAPDELDRLAAKLRLAPRFAGHEPRFHYSQKTFTIHDGRQFVKRTWRVIMDGDRYVALIPADHIQLLAFTPPTAPAVISLRTGRYHLDNIRGPILPTGAFIKHKVRYSPSGLSDITRTDHFRGGGDKITLVRAHENRHWKMVASFDVYVDPRFGYVVEARRNLLLKHERAPRKLKTLAFCPNSYVGWPTRLRYDRTVYTPGGGRTDLAGWANNSYTIAAADGPDETLTWRDGGFVAFLDTRSGWSVARTRQDGCGDANMTVRDLRNLFDVAVGFPDEMERTDANWEVYRGTERLLCLPPEMTRHLAASMTHVRTRRDNALVVRFGRAEDFEGQPVSVREPVRGMAFRGSEPDVTDEVAHSGSRSLALRGSRQPNSPLLTFQPDIANIPLRPNATYLLEGWLKVEDMSVSDRLAYRQAYEALVAKVRAANARLEGKDAEKTPLPEYVAPATRTRAWLTAEVCDWPHEKSRTMAVHKTTAATGDQPGWQKVSCEFTTPAWDPYVKISFSVHSGTAFLDDVTFKRLVSR